MTSGQTGKHRLEVAHVLFTDIVGYSKLPTDAQPERLQRLMQIVRETDVFQRAEADEQLIRLPTGDGMALVFFGDAESAPCCAVEISRELIKHSDLKLRMGLHIGPVYRLTDINTQMNVAGGGINIAQRVMDCGDAGHILVSKALAEMLGQLSRWSESLHDIGEAEVKHGVRVHLFNMYSDHFGNKEMPSKLLHEQAIQTSVNVPLKVRESPDGQLIKQFPKSLRITILYKPHAQPDEQVLKFLEEELRARGHRVFIDRHLSISVEWAKEIEKRINESDIIVPLLSEESVASEMLAYEVQIARERGQQQNGKPRILPVRISLKGPLPEAFIAIAAPIQHFIWAKPSDNQTLLTELLKSVHLHDQVPMSPKDYNEPGGAIPVDAKYYLVRPTDAAFIDAVRRQDSIVLIKGARQMGKTSLLARGIQQARHDGAKVVLTDFQILNSVHLASIDSLFQMLGQLICDQLDLDVSPDTDWNPRRGPSINFTRYVRRHMLGAITTPVVWAMDEVDRLFACDFGSEVFGLFRSWHNERALDPMSPWSRLTLAIAYATEAHLFITDPNQSPFNVGTRLELSDFTLDQLVELNQRFGEPLKSETDVARYYRLVGGHPYLVHRGLYNMKTQGTSLTTFESSADRDEGPFGDHLRRILVLLARDPALCDVVRGILRGHPCPTAKSFYRLRSAGILTGESAREAKPRCILYSTYLKRHLL